MLAAYDLGVTDVATATGADALTAEQFFDLPPEASRGQELIQGELRAMAPAGFEHGRVAAAFVAALRAFVRPAGLGVVLSSETGFTIGRDPDTVRAPDAAFIRADRVPPRENRTGFVELAPDLVVEVVSTSDRATNVLAKALSWLDAGVRLVWVADPALRSVTVYRPDGLARIVRGQDAELDGEDVLPGLRLPLAEVFDP